MSAVEHIRKSISRDVFDYTQLMDALKHYKKPRDVVTSLMRKGRIIRIKKGLYVFGDVWRKNEVSREMLANLIFGPSVISLEYALSWHGLIPERVDTITSVALGRSRKFETPFGLFTYLSQSAQRLSYGASLQDSPSGKWLMAEPLKALADKIWTDKTFSPSSPSSFSYYLLADLRIDEDELSQYCTCKALNELARVYSARKIDWLAKFLIAEYNLKE
jgi:hypothetical protein